MNDIIDEESIKERERELSRIERRERIAGCVLQLIIILACGSNLGVAIEGIVTREWVDVVISSTLAATLFVQLCAFNKMGRK